MSGSFEVVTLPENDPNPVSIGFRQIAGVTSPIADKNFASDLGSDLTLIQRSAAAFLPNYQSNDEFRECYFQFEAAARAGVAHPTADLTLGRAGFAGARDHAIKTIGRSIRNKYLMTLAICCALELVIGVTVFAIAIFVDLGATVQKSGFDIRSMIVAGALGGIGNAMSVFLAANFYLAKLTWPKLDYLDPSGFHPALRIVLVYLITVVLMILLAYKIVILGSWER